MKQFCRKNNEGFTLIEVIITIVMAGILAVMMFTYSNTSYTKSSSLLAKSTETFKLQKVMENIFTDYNINYKSTNLVSLQTNIGGGAVGGNEGSTQNNYGQNGTATNTEYIVVENRFIKFDASNPKKVVNINDTMSDPEYGKCLNVTIKNINSGEALTILLTLIVTQ